MKRSIISTFLTCLALAVCIASLAPKTIMAAPRCTAPEPLSAPIITSIETTQGSVKLTWTEGQDPFTHYLIAFGKSKENLEYGLQNIGGKGTTSFYVNHLENNVKYYFRIRPINDCKPGDFSDTASIVVGVDTEDADLPDMSIYKSSVAISSDAGILKSPAHNRKTPPDTDKVTVCTSNCNALHILTAELLLLAAFFLITGKIKHFRPLTSVVIPIGLYIFFKTTSAGCSSITFFCRYFWQLDLLTYLIALLIFRRKSVRKTVHDLQSQIDQLLQ